MLVGAFGQYENKNLLRIVSSRLLKTDKHLYSIKINAKKLHTYILFLLLFCGGIPSLTTALMVKKMNQKYSLDIKVNSYNANHKSYLCKLWICKRVVKCGCNAKK